MKAATRFEQAKAQADLVALFESYGVKLSKNGKGLVGLCPWHKNGRERTPSLSVTPEKALFRCFACNKAGSAIDLVAEMEGISPKEAVDRLLASSGARPTTKKEEEQKSVEVSAGLLARAAAHYAQSLEQALTARSYLAKRGLCDPVLLERFEIGHGDGSIKTVFSRAEGQAAGFINKRGTDFFYRAITFPLRDPEGRVVSFYARHTQRSRHLYLPGPHRGLFNVPALRSQHSIILTESIIDALSAIRLGVENVLPLYGIHGLTEDHKELIEREKVLEVTLLLDNDDAGERVIEPLAAALEELGVTVYRAELPVGIKDLNDYLVKGRTTEELLEVLERRQKVTGAATAGELVPSEPPSESPPADRQTISIEAQALIPDLGSEAEPAVGESGLEQEQEQEKIPEDCGLVSYEDGVACFELDGLRYEVKGIRLRAETTLRVLIVIASESGLFRDRPDLYL
ncbi:CHC2 zinc finger domain-containing protein, partial [Planctomycetota bacterium]